MKIRTMAALMHGLSRVGRTVSANSNAAVSAPEILFFQTGEAALPNGWEGRGQHTLNRLFEAQWSQGGVPIEFDLSSGYPQLIQGQCVELPATKIRLTIEQNAGVGRRAVVYLAQDAQKHKYAVKVIHEPSPANLASIGLEGVQAELLLSHGIPCAGVVEAGLDYVVKKWQPGRTGDDWLSQAVLPAKEVESLMAFVQHCVEQRVAIYDFKPANLIVDTIGGWSCIDPGKIVVGQAPLDVFAHYRRSLLRKWLKTTPYSVRYWLARLKR